VRESEGGKFAGAPPGDESSMRVERVCGFECATARHFFCGIKICLVISTRLHMAYLGLVG
jgi:hypothetical protein